MNAQGDTWRWEPSRHDYQTSRYISVIEPPSDTPRPKGRRTVPFGFGPRDEPPAAGAVEDEWEGNPS